MILKYKNASNDYVVLGLILEQLISRIKNCVRNKYLTENMTNKGNKHKMLVSIEIQVNS